MKILDTERLILRPWEPDDAAFVLDLYSRWEVQRFIGNLPRIMTGIAEAEERIETWRNLDAVHAVWAVLLETPTTGGTATPLRQPGRSWATRSTADCRMWLR
ncbi:RimJ/RimL family protein N-acetyltransferase [Arthrobacter sp. B1I2]|nr:RimJ/RimL family protein N-acetyltransferase [Arthrobacter sp. B1I2]